MGMFHEGFKGLPSTPQYDRRKPAGSVLAAERERQEVAALIEKYATALQNAVEVTRENYFSPEGDVEFTTAKVDCRTEACSPDCVKALTECVDESDRPKYGQVKFIKTNCQVRLAGSDRELKVMAAVYESQCGEFIAALFVNNQSEYTFFGISD